MTEFEAQTFITKIEECLGTSNTSRLRKHLDSGKLTMESFLGIEIDDISLDSETEHSDSQIRFTPEDAAQIIVNGLNHPPTKANWILFDYIREALLRTELAEIAEEIE